MRVGERLAFEQLHDEKVGLLVAPTSWSVQMCGWLSRGDRPRFALEP